MEWEEKPTQRVYFRPPFVDSHPSYVFVDWGESTLEIHDVQYFVAYIDVNLHRCRQGQIISLTL